MVNLGREFSSYGSNGCKDGKGCILVARVGTVAKVARVGRVASVAENLELPRKFAGVNTHFFRGGLGRRDSG